MFAGGSYGDPKLLIPAKRAGRHRTVGMGRDNQLDVMASVQVELVDHAVSAGTARAAIVEACRRWHLSELVDSAGLLVSELVTNAIRHAEPPISLLIARPSTDMLRVEVADHSSDPPEADLYPDTETPGGRGLLIVDSFATRWGYQPVGNGKIVWFELASKPATTQP